MFISPHTGIFWFWDYALLMQILLALHLNDPQCQYITGKLAKAWQPWY